MKKIFLFCFISLLSIQKTRGQVSGVKTIPGDYASITDAIQHIGTLGVSGPVFLELQTGYNSAAETFPIKVRAIPGISSVNSLTISPAAGATGIDITSDTIGSVVELIGARNIVIDGRPGRTGLGRELTIRNSSATGRAISFVDGAVNNLVTNCRLERSAITTSFSDIHVVYFGRSSELVPINILLENFDNTLSNCIVASLESESTRSIIKADGTSTVQNKGNKIIDNEILNFRLRGIEIAQNGGGSGWTITGNSLYNNQHFEPLQTAIAFLPGPGSINNTISGNFIGGQAAHAGGEPWRVGGGSIPGMNGIQISAGSVVVENNIIRNISVVGVEFTTAFCTGITVLDSSSAQITGNLIGGDTDTNEILVRSVDGASCNFAGIRSIACSPVSIQNNRISNITMQSFSLASSRFSGIEFRSGMGIEVTGNQIDQVTASSTGTINFAAIRTPFMTICPSGLEFSLIDHNLIRDIIVSSDNDSAIFTGIELADGLANNTGNIIGSATEPNSIMVTGKYANATAILANESPDASISDHIIGNITVNGTLSALLNGIRFQDGGVAKVNGNKLNDLSVNSSGPAAMVGIGIKGGSLRSTPSTLHNNQVHKINVSSSDDAASFSGIEVNGKLAGNTGNIIGSATEANNIMVTGKSASATGIRLNNSANVSINDDIIANITANGSLTPGSVNGILFEGGTLASIAGNNVRHLTAPVSRGIFIQPSNGSSTVTLEKNTLTGINNNTGNGIETFVASQASLNLTAKDNTVGNWKTGVLLAAASGVTLQQTFQYNSIVANQTGFINQTSTAVNATCNWWGHASGPGGAGPGTGNPVGPNIIFNPWVTIPTYIAVNAGADQTIYIGYGSTSVTLTPIVTVCGTPAFLWSTGATTASITVSPVVTAVYSITVTDDNGHSATDEITVFVEDVRCGNNNKVLICHNGHEICVSINAVQAHFNHGDSPGSCAPQSRGDDPVVLSPTEVTGAEPNKNSSVLPAVYKFYNYPNPFKGSSTIRYELPVDSKVSIQVYDVMGRVVAILVDTEKKAGIHTVAFHAGKLTSRFLYYKIIAQSKDELFEQTNKMIQTR